MGKSQQPEFEKESSGQINLCLLPHIGDLQPVISELLLKDDAFANHMGKMIEEITRTASACLSVRI